MTENRRVKRVIMFPGQGVKNNNRYIDVLVESLRAAGVEVEDWDKHFSRQRGEIFHVHWPEVILDIRARKFQLLRGEWIAFQFFRTIRRIKRHGGRVVWTVHGLAPHDKKVLESAFLKKLMSRFIPCVDVALSLTFAGIAEIKRTIPALNDVPHFVTRHPHYRGILGPAAYNREARVRFGISQLQKVFALVGTLRPDKRADLVARAFRDLPSDRAFLIIAGSASADIAETIAGLTKGRPNVRLDLRRVSEEEVLELYSVSDILVFPGTDYFNSGTVYTALSLGVPVVAAWSPSNLEIQNIVGAQWLYLYQGTFSREVLEDASRVLVRRDTGASCDLTAFSPEVCAIEHIEAYEKALSRPRSAR